MLRKSMQIRQSLKHPASTSRSCTARRVHSNLIRDPLSPTLIVLDTELIAINNEPLIPSRFHESKIEKYSLDYVLPVSFLSD